MNWLIGITLAFVWLQGIFWLLLFVVLKRVLYMRRSFQNLMQASQGGLFNMPKTKFTTEEVNEVSSNEE